MTDKVVQGIVAQLYGDDEQDFRNEVDRLSQQIGAFFYNRRNDLTEVQRSMLVAVGEMLEDLSGKLFLKGH